MMVRGFFQLITGIVALAVLVLVTGCAQPDAETPGANPTSTENTSGMTAVPESSLNNSSVPSSVGDSGNSGK
ncbi:MAG: hypothetical protein KF824_13295 [Fimbriimonadaceae bacterium]|nr:MAG: hypothetical protein KF824_13295 [Fimbriimonadaceae bacterium]